MNSLHCIANDPRTMTRRQRSARPTCEALEGRALLAHYSAYDPTFGRNGAVIGAADDGTGTGTELSTGYAVAVGTDGKVVEVGTYGTNPRSSVLFGQLAVRRYNADGTVDTSFGTSGQANIPLPSTAIGIQVGPRNVVVQADGSILVAATAALPGSTSGPLVYTEGFVAKLTAAGQLDTSFGTGGEYVFVGTTTSAASVAVDGDDNVLVLGANNKGAVGRFGSQSAGSTLLVVTRLTAAGALDVAFNGTGSLAIDLPAYQLNAGGFSNYTQFYSYTPATLSIDPSTGRIYVVGNDVDADGAGGVYTYYANLSRVNSNGTLDTTFGTGGTVAVGTYLSRGFKPTIKDMAFDGDGNLVVVGSSRYFYSDQAFLNRLRPDGTLDPTFVGNSTGASDTLTDGISFNSVAVGTDGAITVGASTSYADGGSVYRYTAAGALDVGFGSQGRYWVNPSAPVAAGQAAFASASAVNDVALTANGNFVVAGQLQVSTPNLNTTRYNLLAQLQRVKVTRLIGDYDGDGVSDVAAYLPGSAIYAYRPSSGGTNDVLQTFGSAGAGASIPAPGDFDDDGKTDLGVYIPSQGKFYYRTSHGYDSNFVLGDARSIPAPGDYDGDGSTDMAVYDPTTGSFIIRDSSNFSNLNTRTIQFGATGPGGSIPAPGDYDGDGITDLAVYLPASGVYAYRPSSGGLDILQSFGLPGDRMSIPAPGDYDGDGTTDLAVYLPSLGVYAYRPSAANPVGDDVLRSFGLVGDGATIPAPGDYDGDGRFDIAAYLPQLAIYAYRPSSAVVAGADVVTTFGAPGTGVTIPTASIPYAQPATVSRMSLAAPRPEAGVPLALTDDVLELLVGTKKKRS